MVALNGWVASHTGMPSFLVTGGVEGRVYQVWASDGTREWVAFRGRYRGQGIAFSDPVAPVAVPVTYTLGALSKELTRRSLGGHMLTDRYGRRPAVFRWLGEDDTDHNVTLSQMATSKGMADRWPLTPPPATVALEALTATAGTENLRSLLVEQRRLILVHDSTVCEMVDCDIPPVRVVSVSRASEKRTPHVPHAHRDWSLTCEVRDGVVDVTEYRRGANLPDVWAPVVTWREWRDYTPNGGWEDDTYRSLLIDIAGMPS